MVWKGSAPGGDRFRGGGQSHMGRAACPSFTFALFLGPGNFLRLLTEVFEVGRLPSARRVCTQGSSMVGRGLRWGLLATGFIKGTCVAAVRRRASVSSGGQLASSCCRFPWQLSGKRSPLPERGARARQPTWSCTSKIQMPRGLHTSPAESLSRFPRWKEGTECALWSLAEPWTLVLLPTRQGTGTTQPQLPHL